MVPVLCGTAARTGEERSHQRVVEPGQGGHRTDRLDPSIAQYRDTVRHLPQKIQVVRHDHDAQAEIVAQATHQVIDTCRRS